MNRSRLRRAARAVADCSTHSPNELACSPTSAVAGDDADEQRSRSTNKKHIEECVRDSLEGYFKDLRGAEPTAMYEMVLQVVEKPLLEVVHGAGRGQPEPRRRDGWASTATRCASKLVEHNC